MTRPVLLTTLLTLAGLATAATLAWAGTHAEAPNDASADLAKAKVSLVQAVQTAQTQAGGQATRAELDSEHGGLAYSVEVVDAKQQVLDVQVDAISGKVLSSRADVKGSGKHDDEDD
jgi:uncharacterized membrane protein YkoI